MDLKEKLAELNEKGCSLTIQRHAILEYLYENRTHPTVEKIYYSLKEKFSTISRATVYNTLELLKNYGLIQEITIEKGKSRFDYEVKTHHHFLCHRCNRVYDVNVEGCPLAGKKMINGHKIEELRPYIIGICSKCLQKKKSNDNFVMMN
ncbi:MAG: transcriptional repressor [Desulfobacteraceae bacterium]|nr:transcriptional repressor [Desulfobacteraceae bacterium]MBC2719572.1 transcriptional repressor [Desulfobacteraceae bacterium]